MRILIWNINALVRAAAAACFARLVLLVVKHVAQNARRVCLLVLTQPHLEWHSAPFLQTPTVRNFVHSHGGVKGFLQHHKADIACFQVLRLTMRCCWPSCIIPAYSQFQQFGHTVFAATFELLSCTGDKTAFARQAYQRPCLCPQLRVILGCFT